VRPGGIEAGEGAGAVGVAEECCVHGASRRAAAVAPQPAGPSLLGEGVCVRASALQSVLLSAGAPPSGGPACAAGAAHP